MLAKHVPKVHSAEVMVFRYGMYKTVANRSSPGIYFNSKLGRHFRLLLSTFIWSLLKLHIIQAKRIMAKIGSFTFVLHSHIPYTRQAGSWPYGEEWIHEASAETYIPLLHHLYDMLREGVPVRLTIGLTPILVEQLADEHIQKNFLQYLQDRIAAIKKDISRFEADNKTHYLYLARYYQHWYENIQRSFVERFNSNLVPAFRKLQDEGLIEIVTCAATHGYLPLFDRDETINFQLQTAVQSYERHFGRKPRAIWLPECAYRPAYIDTRGRTRKGIESFLERFGLGLFFAETHMIEGGRPVGIAAGDAIGPYAEVTRRYIVPFSEGFSDRPASTYEAYYVTKPQVAVLGRNNQTGLQVWSAQMGYPGEFDYRDFHKKDGSSGMQYWRITGARVGLDEKDIYRPESAAIKVGQHIDHFSQLVENLLQTYYEETGRRGIISANYDTGLFGHWWFEGVDWIAGVMRKLAVSSSIELTTASTYIEDNPPKARINLREGSWGAGGNHFVWDNADTHWLWPIIHEAESRMGQIVTENLNAPSDVRLVLNQAGRELLLLQSSDWPFLITTGQAKDYATQRFRQHLDRFYQMLDSVANRSPNTELAGKLWEMDKIFPEIDFRWYKE